MTDSVFIGARQRAYQMAESIVGRLPYSTRKLVYHRYGMSVDSNPKELLLRVFRAQDVAAGRIKAGGKLS